MDEILEMDNRDIDEFGVEAEAEAKPEGKWENRNKRRQYHYNGVKPIMNFVGINEPLNLPLLYILTIVIVPFFLIVKVLRGTIGALISGAVDERRPKSVKVFLWAVAAVIVALAVAGIVFLFLNWQNNV